MSKKIVIVLPDGVDKRTMILSMDLNTKWGHAFYLDVFKAGIDALEKKQKEKSAEQKPETAAPDKAAKKREVKK